MPETTITLPCKIGDKVYAIRRRSGKSTITSGRVSEMYFTDDMELTIVLRCICRGPAGKTVFTTYEEAERALEDLS